MILIMTYKPKPVDAMKTKGHVGFTENLKLRFEQYCKGLVDSTKNRRPLKLIYFEGCLNQQDALRRKKVLKNPLR